MAIKGPESCGYVDLLDYMLVKQAEEKEAKLKSGELKINPLRPSAAGKCSRALALELDMFRNGTYYARPPTEPRISRLLDLGHSVEFHALKQFRVLEVLQQKYKQQVLSFFEVERGSPEFERQLIEGQCDFVLYSDSYKCIGDVKSKGDRFSYSHKSKWDEDLERYSKMKTATVLSEQAFWVEDLPAFLDELGEDFMVDNFLQLNLYANADFIKDRGINHCFLYYYSKVDSRHFEMRFNPSVKLFEKVREKFNRVSIAVDNKEIPTGCDFTPGSIRYAFCDCHTMLPYAANDPVKQWFKSLPPKSWPKDLNKLPNSPDLTKLFEEFEGALEASKVKDKIELKIVKELLEQKVNKVKLDNGNVYQLKFLKTPKEHYELRRTKL